MLLPKTLLIICSVFLLFSYYPLNALIVPQELPTLLSIVYSNIPVIKKGTDSRLGFGFRLGDHADFQVMVELGPQKETRPIGDQSGETSFNKRQISKAEQNAIIRKQLKEQLKLQQQQQQQQQDASSSTKKNPTNWLETWSQDMDQHKKANKLKLKELTAGKKQQQNDKPHVIPTYPELPHQTLQQLQLLYKMATTTLPPSTEHSSLVNTESASSLDLEAMAEHLKKKAQITKELMNVSLEDSE